MYCNVSDLQVLWKDSSQQMEAKWYKLCTEMSFTNGCESFVMELACMGNLHDNCWTFDCRCNYSSSFWSSTGHVSLGLTVGSASPCEERLGLPRARHSRFQPHPTHPLQGTAEPHSQGGGILGCMCKKGQKMPQRDSGSGERSKRKLRKQRDAEMMKRNNTAQ